MLVDPYAVRSPHLLVDEKTGRIPFRNLALPPQRNAAQTQPIVDLQAFAHLDRFRGQHLEAQPWRCQFLEIARFREEIEDVRQRLR